MDTTVQIFLIFLVAMCFAVGINWIKRSLWVAFLSLALASFIAYGLYVQCDNVAVFYRCR